MNFDIKNVPYENLEKIGVSKKQILSLPLEEQKAMLKGRTTGVMEINDGTGRKTKAKLSLYPEADGSLGIKVHEVQKKVEIPAELNKKQGEALTKGENVVAPATSKNGIKEDYMYKIDAETNQVMRTRIANIKIPDNLEGVKLDAAQINDLYKGKSVDLMKPDGRVVEVTIDITDLKGYKANPYEEEKSVKKGKEKAEEKQSISDDLLKKDKPENKQGRTAKQEVKSKIKAGLALGPIGMIADEIIVKPLEKKLKR